MKIGENAPINTFSCKPGNLPGGPLTYHKLPRMFVLISPGGGGYGEQIRVAVVSGIKPLIRTISPTVSALDHTILGS